MNANAGKRRVTRCNPTRSRQSDDSGRRCAHRPGPVRAGAGLGTPAPRATGSPPTGRTGCSPPSPASGLWCTAAVPRARTAVRRCRVGCPGSAGRLAVACRRGPAAASRAAAARRGRRGSACCSRRWSPARPSVLRDHAGRSRRPARSSADPAACAEPGRSTRRSTQLRCLHRLAGSGAARHLTLTPTTGSPVHSGATRCGSSPAADSAADGRPAGRAQIAAAWPRWYAANRPRHRLRPGVHPPPARCWSHQPPWDQEDQA